jgi:hypothetical protein
MRRRLSVAFASVFGSGLRLRAGPASVSPLTANSLPPTPAAARTSLLILAAAMGKKSGPKFYAVHTGRGGFRGVVDDWPTCRRLVSGVRGAVFKSFATRAEAAVFAEAGRGRTAGGPPSAAVQHSPPPAAAGRAAQARSERGAGVVTAAAGASTVVVYTDGACTNNGRRHARAGVGVYFGPADAMNLSQPLQGESQTNQRAEQTGVLRAMQLAVSQRRVKRGDTLVIRTDSNVSCARRGRARCAAGFPTELRLTVCCRPPVPTDAPSTR